MRGLETVLGVALVFGGAFFPLNGLLDGDPTGTVTGQVHFFEASFDGPASISASDAILRVQGPVKATILATNVSLEVHRYTRTGVRVATAAGGVALYYNQGESIENLRFPEARIHLGGTPSGLVHVLPDRAGGGPQRLVLTLSPESPPPIFASPNGATFWVDGFTWQHELPGPLFALGHEGARYREPNTADTSFEEFHADGSSEWIINETTITVDHPGGQYTLRTGSSEGRGAFGAAGLSVEQTFALITMETAAVDLPFDSVSTTFYARDPTLNLSGSLTVEGADGQIQGRNRSHALSGETVELYGNATLSMRALGNDDRFPFADELRVARRVPSELLPAPIVQADLTGQADRLVIDGREVKAPSTPTLPGEVTLVAKILGALLVLWGAGKKILVFLATLFVRDPLDNQRRRRIVEVVEQAGMAHLREIQRATGMALGSVAYHVRVLRRAGLLASIHRAGYTVYFVTPTDLSHDDMRRLALLADQTRRRLAELLLEGRCASQHDLAVALGLSRSSVSRQLAQLEKAGLVERRGNRNIEYAPSGLLRSWLPGHG